MPKAKRRFKVGDVVRLKIGQSNLKGPRRKGKIVRFLRDVDGGVVVDAALDGVFRLWNVEHLEGAEEDHA